VDRDATAFGLRDDQWDYDVISQWTTSAESAGHISWTREFWKAVEPLFDRRDLCKPSGCRGGGAYSRNYEQLVGLKNKYDPTNLFLLNQNIKPTV
jgi:Berberine and berberine like